MRSQDKKRVITGTLLIGIICIVMVVITAYCAELKCENNKLMAENEATQGEIDTLNEMCIRDRARRGYSGQSDC